MIILGHRFIKSQNFYHISSIDAILKTPPSSTLFVDFDEDNLDIIEHLRSNAIPFALGVSNLKEIVYASALDASFIIVTKEFAQDAQNVANEYLFDAKILVMIDNEDEIEPLIRQSIDGVIFSNAFIKISS